MPLDLRLTAGPCIRLLAINQSHTYEGLIEGLPTVEMNRSIMTSAVESARELWMDVPYLISPQETPIERSRPYPFGSPASIPRILCKSRWQSPFESRGDLDGCAELTIVWFQSEFAMPIAPDVLVQIEAIDWHMHSTFVEL